MSWDTGGITLILDPWAHTGSGTVSWGWAEGNGTKTILILGRPKNSVVVMRADICVIIPTIRNHEIIRAYTDNAAAHGFDLDRLHFVLVTEDFCETDAMEELLTELGVSGVVFDGSTRETWLADHGIEDYSHLIPAASHAQTSFGLLYMWANEFEYGVFIDDDTHPHPAFDYFGRHLHNLNFDGTIERVQTTSQWVNVLYQNAETHGLYPRGYPYDAMDETIHTDTTHIRDVVVSQGLWTNVPDVDAVRILMDGDLNGQARTRLTKADYTGSFVAAADHYLTVCSMNLAFRREVIPAFYQLPMDDNPWDIGRFDDIWSGVFLKRVCDRLDKSIITGYPLCEHHKAQRSTFDDLETEAPGLELNEHLWRVADRATVPAASYTAAYAALAETLVTTDFEYANGGFLNHIGESMLDWLACLETLDSTASTPPINTLADD